jgi:hypothetical protein
MGIVSKLKNKNPFKRRIASIATTIEVIPFPDITDIEDSSITIAIVTDLPDDTTFETETVIAREERSFSWKFTRRF